jgi:hypothetical protein
MASRYGSQALGLVTTAESVITSFSLAGFEVGFDLPLGRFCRAKVGDHFVGRFWFAPPPTTGRTHCNPGRFQTCAGGFATDSGRLLDAPQRPAQPSRAKTCCFFSFQDIGHAHGAYKSPRESMSRTLLSLAGFQVIISGRFWVIAEVSTLFSTTEMASGSSTQKVGLPTLTNAWPTRSPG